MQGQGPGVGSGVFRGLGVRVHRGLGFRSLGGLGFFVVSLQPQLEAKHS